MSCSRPNLGEELTALSLPHLGSAPTRRPALPPSGQSLEGLHPPAFLPLARTCPCLQRQRKTPHDPVHPKEDFECPMTTWAGTHGLTAGGSKHLRPARPCQAVQRLEPRSRRNQPSATPCPSQPGRDKEPKARPPHWPGHLAPAPRTSGKGTSRGQEVLASESQ